MHLVALVESPEHVCCRYRLAAFRPFLERAGHRLTFAPLPRRWWQCWRGVGELRGAAVVLQRRLLPGWQRRLLRRLAGRLLFDLDDAIFLRDVYHHLTRPQEFDASLLASLKPGGRLAIMDFPPDPA